MPSLAARRCRARGAARAAARRARPTSSANAAASSARCTRSAASRPRRPCLQPRDGHFSFQQLL